MEEADREFALMTQYDDVARDSAAMGGRGDRP